MMYEPDFDWKGERFTVKNGYAVKIPKKWCPNDDAYEDKNVLIALLKTDGFNLNYASNELKDDFDVVLAAIEQDGNSILYARARLRTNVNLIIEAFKNSVDIAFYLGLSLELRKDMDIIHAMLEEYPQHLDLLPHEIKTNQEKMLEIIMRNTECFDQKISIPWNREVLIYVMQFSYKKTGAIMKHFYDGSLEMYIAALTFGPTGCYIRDDKTKKDNRLVAKAFFGRETCLELKKFDYISERLLDETYAYINRPDDDEIIALLCKTNKYANHVPEEIWPLVFEHLT